MPTEFSPLPIYESLTLNLTSLLNKANKLYKSGIFYALLITVSNRKYLFLKTLCLQCINARLQAIKTCLHYTSANMKWIKTCLHYITATMKWTKTCLQSLTATMKWIKTCLQYHTATIKRLRTCVLSFISIINTDFIYNSINFLLFNFLKTNVYDK